MEDLLKVRIIDTHTGKALTSPSGKDYFMLNILPALESEYTYMKPYAPQRYEVIEIYKAVDGIYEVKLQRVEVSQFRIADLREKYYGENFRDWNYRLKRKELEWLLNEALITDEYEKMLEQSLDLLVESNIDQNIVQQLRSSFDKLSGK